MRAKPTPNKEVEDLKAQLANAIAQRDAARKDWLEEMNKSGHAMANSMKVGQLEKQMRVINHIAAGRITEAILEILTPMPMLFSVDVRFADDKSRMAAEDELFVKVKRRLAEDLQSLTLERKPKGADEEKAEAR